MPLPVSVGDVIELCKAIVSIYQFCRNSPSEMERAVEKVEYVATILEAIQSRGRRLSYLESADGERLKHLLKAEISRLQRSLKTLKRIVLKWKKSWPKLRKRVLFLVFTLPDVPELRANLDARMTGIDRILNLANGSGGKLNPTQFNALMAALQRPIGPPRPMDNKDNPERRAVKEALKAAGAAQANGPEPDPAKKANLLQALSANGVSGPRSEAITQIYEQESKHIPVKLPKHVPKDPVRRPSPVHGIKPPATLPKPAGLASNRSSTCEILVVDSVNGCRSLMAHAYLEFYRAWVANNHGGWLFHRVDSAGLNIATSFRSSDEGSLDSDNLPLQASGRKLDPLIFDAISGDATHFVTDDSPFEKASIIGRIQTHRARGIGRGIFSRYKYIITFESRYVTALEKLQERARSSPPDNAAVEPNKTPAARIMLLPETTFVSGKPLKDYMLPISKAVARFLTAEFGYERPAHSIAGGGLRTSFMQVALPVQMRRVKRELGRIERQSGCKVYLAAESVAYGWVVAVVGLQERLGEAEGIIRELRGAAAGHVHELGR